MTDHVAVQLYTMAEKGKKNHYLEF